MRWAAYAGVGIPSAQELYFLLTKQVSATLAAGVLVKALSERPNFYSTAVYLAQSSANLMVRRASSISQLHRGGALI
jgi:hypothetical protein